MTMAMSLRCRYHDPRMLVSPLWTLISVALSTLSPLVTPLDVRSAPLSLLRSPDIVFDMLFTFSFLRFALSVLSLFSSVYYPMCIYVRSVHFTLMVSLHILSSSSSFHVSIFAIWFITIISMIRNYWKVQAVS